MNASWPLVDPNDDGIRPAGAPDECLYCHSRVGVPHGLECVIVTKRVEMRVRASLPSGDVFTGLWQFDEPYEWDVPMTEFHKNDSSWCAGNFVSERDLGTVAWDAGDPWADLVAAHDAGDCLCQRLSFEFVRVVDDTPRRALNHNGAA